MSATWIKLLAFCGAMAMAAPVMAADTVKIGVAGAHSGEYTSYGMPSLNAVSLVVDQFNAKGGLLGKPVELISQDDQCKPEIATNAATKLLSDKVDIVMGHTCSGATKAALPLYTNAKMIAMSPSATTTALTMSGQNPYFFRTIANDDSQGIMGGNFAVKNLGAKKIAILHDNGEYGKAYAEIAQDTIKKLGGAEIVLFEAFTPGAADYSSVIGKVRQKGAEVLIFGGYYADASKMLGNMRDREFDIPMIGPDGLKDQGFLQLAGPNAEGVYASGPQDTSANPMSIEAAKAHQAKYGTPPGAFFDNAYTAALALLTAIENAGSTEVDKVMAALHDKEVDTPMGKVRFDKNGDAIGVGMSMYQIKDGKYVEVATATGN